MEPSTLREPRTIEPRHDASIRWPARCPACWWGGGRHALACAATLADRCAAAATMAGVARSSAEALDWMAGMGQDNVDEFSAALAGAETLEPLLQKWAAELKNVQGPDIAE